MSVKVNVLDHLVINVTDVARVPPNGTARSSAWKIPSIDRVRARPPEIADVWQPENRTRDGATPTRSSGLPRTMKPPEVRRNRVLPHSEHAGTGGRASCGVRRGDRRRAGGQAGRPRRAAVSRLPLTPTAA